LIFVPTTATTALSPVCGERAFYSSLKVESVVTTEYSLVEKASLSTESAGE
jgi:hypothetical protein